MKIKEAQTHTEFKFTEIYPFHAADATDEETARSGYFEVVHPSPFRPKGGVRINISNSSREPYTLAEIDAYIAGLQKAREISAGLQADTAGQED